MQQMSAPLTGIRVVELTTAWAGPMAGRTLAFLGAEVIRIEPASRPDSWRHPKITFNNNRYPDRDPGLRPHNRSSLFNTQNINKLSMALDLKCPGGHETLIKLLAISDVVISNFTPGTLDRLKLGYQQLRQLKKDIIVLEMPAFGNKGPMANNPALGPTMEMVAGMASLIGYPDGPPTVTGPAYLDPTGGYNAAAAIMTALVYRQATGEGQHIELPQCEAAMQYIGELILSAAATGENPQPQGNRVSWAAPHDTFPARGHDAWVAIAVTNDEEWRALCAAMGMPDLATHPDYATLSDRLRHGDALHERIASWTRHQDKHEAAALLQSAGVPAAPVNTAKDLVQSRYLAERDFFTTLDHPEAGSHPYQGLPFHLTLTPGAQRRAAPCLGADTHFILSDLLKLSENEIQVLHEAGTISPIPA